jgi:DNA-binding transcriptional ArsR family regulator
MDEDAVFKAIADPTRRAIIGLLGEEQASVSELQRRFTISQPAVSQHLRVLREAGLVSERREGRRRIYELNAEPLALARLWLDRHTEFWASRLDNLGRHLRSNHGPDA